MPGKKMILTQYLVFNQKKQQALKKCLLLLYRWCFRLSF